MHQANLLCLIYRGIQINKILNRKDLLTDALSALPARCAPETRLTFSYLDKFLSWLKRTVSVNKTVVNGDHFDVDELDAELTNGLSELSAKNFDELVFITIILLRALGFQVRLMYSLDPIGIRVPYSERIYKEKCLDPTSSRDNPFNKKVPKEKQTGESKGTSATTDDKKAIKNCGAIKRGSKIVSSDSESNGESTIVTKKNSKNVRQFWPEIFEEESQKWVPIDVEDGSYMCMEQIEVFYCTMFFILFFRV